MFIEDIIKGKDKYHEVKIEGFDNYFEMRELTTREQKEMQAMGMKGVERPELDDVVETDEDGKIIEKEIPTTIDIGQYALNAYDSIIFLIKTVVRTSKKKTGKKAPISDKVLKYLTEEQITWFLDAYNEKFSPEKVESFPESEEESC